MTSTVSGRVTAFFLYDVAEAVDLDAVGALLGGAGQSARFAARSPVPAYVRYTQPPVQVDADVLGGPLIDGWTGRVKVYDYGVVSLALSRPFEGTWADLIALSQELMSGAPIDAKAEETCRAAAAQLRPALREARDTFLSEDYFVFGLTSIDGAPAAAQVLASHGEDIARLVRGETEALSAQERDDVLRHRLSYFASDLVVPSWNGAFVYDNEAGLTGALEILEFGNSQLLQFRYYDHRLDLELQKIYALLQAPKWYEAWIGRRYNAAARELHGVFIDVNELTDRTENALKLVGDVYAARLLGLAAARLGVDVWKDAVKDKLKTLDDIYRFAVDQTTMARGEILEASIVLILVFELVLFFMGIMK
ncbi:MAG: hypothetical protein KA371_17005 [Acidobacteria bacterium]|nr:hypothetical protein [Acidobacteriota bacterium]